MTTYFETIRWEQLEALERPSDEARSMSCELLDSWAVDVINRLSDDAGRVNVFLLKAKELHLTAKGVRLMYESLGGRQQDARFLIKGRADAMFANDNDLITTKWHACRAHGFELIVVRKRPR